MCLHFRHLYILSPSHILIAPDRITVPLRESRIPRCLALTHPILGEASIHIKNYSLTKIKKLNSINKSRQRKKKITEHLKKIKKNTNQEIEVNDSWYEHEWTSSRSHIFPLYLSSFRPIKFSNRVKLSKSKSFLYKFQLSEQITISVHTFNSA